MKVMFQRSIAMAVVVAIVGLAVNSASAVVITWQSAQDLASQANGGVGFASSTGFGTSPPFLNDNNVSGAFGDGSVAHSSSGGAGNIMGVTLSQPYVLGEVIIWNRTDCCGFRIDGGGATPFTLELFNGATSVYSGNFLFTQDISLSSGGSTASGMTVVLPNVFANKVQIKQNNADLMNLAEIQAFGVPEPSTLMLLGLGLAGLYGGYRRLRK